MPISPTSGDTELEPQVYVIRSSYHYEDGDRRQQIDEAVMEDEGWFEDEVAAANRCEQLNAQTRRAYDVAMDRSRRERQGRIDAALQTNADIEILRANGLDRKLVPVPKPFVPVPFEDWQPDSFTKYSVETMRRSEHDTLARAEPSATATT